MPVDLLDINNNSQYVKHPVRYTPITAVNLIGQNVVLLVIF